MDDLDRAIALEAVDAVFPDFIPGDYVLATKWTDGDPQDHWCVGFYAARLHHRYIVVDNEGHRLRANGFARCGKISAQRGTLFVKHATTIEQSRHSLWWWRRQPLRDVLAMLEGKRCG